MRRLLIPAVLLVIIAAGGSFIGLSIKSAQWLGAHGFAAFVLKYRTKQIEGKDFAELAQSARATFMAQLNNHRVSCKLL